MKSRTVKICRDAFHLPDFMILGFERSKIGIKAGINVVVSKNADGILDAKNVGIAYFVKV